MAPKSSSGSLTYHIGLEWLSSKSEVFIARLCHVRLSHVQSTVSESEIDTFVFSLACFISVSDVNIKRHSHVIKHQCQNIYPRVKL